MPPRGPQFSRFVTEVRLGSRTVRNAVMTAAWLGAANERDRTLRLIEGMLVEGMPPQLADALKAAILAAGVRQVVGAEPGGG